MQSFTTRTIFTSKVILLKENIGVWLYEAGVECTGCYIVIEINIFRSLLSNDEFHFSLFSYFQLRNERYTSACVSSSENKKNKKKKKE